MVIWSEGWFTLCAQRINETHYYKLTLFYVYNKINILNSTSVDHAKYLMIIFNEEVDVDVDISHKIITQGS